MQRRKLIRRSFTRAQYWSRVWELAQLVAVGHILIVSLVLTAFGSEQQPIKEALELCSAMPSDEKAAPSCRKAIDEGIFESGWRLPETQSVYRRLGAAAESLGRFDDAVRVYRAGTRQYPENPEFFARLGWLLLDYFDASAEAWGPSDQLFLLSLSAIEIPGRPTAHPVTVS
jgi:cytochrome c-type biogenesis protein CcmH/NrfG